jgi:hypothetical protein
MDKCLLCKSNNVEKIPLNATNKDGIFRDYRNEVTRSASVNRYYPDTYLCLDCGYLMRKLDSEALDTYKTDMGFFIDKED